MTRIVGNYTLGDRLGRGGMSEVYAGQHRFLGTPVAIKLLRPEVAAEATAAEAFLAEAERTRQIQHPNVVQVHDFGRDDATGSHYLVLERVNGDSLAARLATTGAMTDDAVRALGAALADGMQAVHDAGLVHRDLKPANVMLAGDAPKVVDFGIAKHLGNRSAVKTERRIGTVAYMAPEQLSGGVIAPCVDVWALGVILFEAATGQLPFTGFDDGRCPQLFETAPRASTRAPVSPGLDAIIARCLAPNPGERPASMTEVARALRTPDAGERLTEDLGALVPPVPVSTVPEAPVPRRRGWLVVGLLGLVSLIGVAWAIGSDPAVTPARADADAQAATPPPQADAAVVPDARGAPDAMPPPPDAAPRKRTRKRRPRAPRRPAPTEETLD